MHRTFNMGTGFVCTLPPADAESLVDATDGRLVGHVEAADGEGRVSIRGIEL
jgi:phosphoribosylformylglycinamidine cyclo-ligase